MSVSQVTQRRTWFTQYRTSNVTVNLGRFLVQGNYLELILTVKMETTHPVESGHLVANFRRSVIIAELWRPEVARPRNFVSNFCVFLLKTISLKLSLLSGLRPKSTRASPHTWLTLFQISSKSVHFRRSYCRTREDSFCSVEYFQYRLFKPIATNITHRPTVLE